jgi:hypothetical protein
MKNQLVRKVVGAFVGAVAVASIFALVGYSDEGPTTSDYVRELAVALASYLPAAFLIQWLTQRDNVILDIVAVTLTGSALSFLMKLIFLEGQNGIPSYIARSTSEHSWKPFGDLAFHSVSFIMFATLLSLPFVTIGVGLCRIFAKNDRFKNPQL